jgi:hypothetical protein
MKTLKHCTIAALCVLTGGMVFAAPALAGDGDQYILSLSQEKIDLIEKNVVNALTSDIPGMQADAAALVRELKNLRPEQTYSGCVVPLMGIVKDEEAEPAARILAALALDKLESSMGHYAISRTALFTDNPRVKHVCTWLAYERKVGKTWDDKGMAYIEPLEEIEFAGY